MRRREFLGSLTAASACALSPLLPAQARPALRVAVIGGGIVGASIAMHLAEAGARVTLLEKTGPAKGATEKSFAWVNTYQSQAHYRALRLESLLAYRELDIPLQLGITWGGYLNWTDAASEVDSLREYAASVAGTPCAWRTLSPADVTQLNPAVAPGAITAAFFSTIDGHLDPVWVTWRLLDRAKLLGAKLIFPCEVIGFDFRGHRLAAVATTRGRFVADRVVVAAGVDTPRLLSWAGFSLQLRHAPGILTHSLPIPEATKMVCDAPHGIEFKQMASGRIVGTDAVAPPDTAAHRQIRDHATDFTDEILRTMHGTRILERISTYLPAAKAATYDFLTLGFRPMPLDGFPVIGAVPGAPDVYVAVTHSGVTLAPILGRYVTRELLGGEIVEALAPYRPSRFGG